jgi:hypothetical protein
MPARLPHAVPRIRPRRASLVAPPEIHHIRDMPNIQKKAMNAAQHRFIDDIAALFMHWGMPQTEARLYAYLMLSAAPVSLDCIVESLQMSKSSASVAARALEQYRLAHKHRVRGSKRVLYEASNDFSGRLARQSALLGTIGQLIRERTPAVAAGKAATRLQILSDFYLSLGTSMETAIRAFNERVADAQKPAPARKPRAAR